jgi:hypothetical protein
MHFSTLHSVTVALRRPVALPLVLAATLVGAGCGSSEDADFVDGYNAAVAPLSATMSDLSASPAGSTKAASKSLDPPEDAADELDRMLGALEKGTGQIRAMAGAAKEGDVKQLTKATADFSATGTDLVTIEQELRTVLEN